MLRAGGAQDEDQKLSFEDVRQSCEVLQLGMSDEAIRRFHSDAARGGDFIDLEGWKQVLSAPEGLEAVLESRGLSRSELQSEPATTALSVQEMLNIIKAALSYNSLSVEEGFQSFDIDQDDKISLADLGEAVSSLQLGIPVSDVRVLHSHLDPTNTGFIALSTWTANLEVADGETILMSRGVTAQQSRISQEESVLDTAAETPSRAIDVVAATLSYNSLTADKGFEAFDLDEDGKLSLNDLMESANQLQMGIADADLRTLFASLEDAADPGFINKEAWVQAVGASDTADVLRSRGVSMPAPAEYPENVQAAINTIGAALLFNRLSTDEGYEAFDADEDGKVSFSDLMTAVAQLQLEITEQDGKRLLESLDARSPAPWTATGSTSCWS